MYIGTQGHFPEDVDLEVLAQLGVNNIDTTPDEPLNEWTTDLLSRYRERCAKFGINLEMMHLIGSGNALKDKYTGAIFLKPSDERERKLDLVCDIIRMAGEAGLRGLNYNITNLGHLRTERTLGRGGAILSTFNRSGFNSPKLASFLIHKVYIKCLGACPEDLYLRRVARKGQSARTGRNAFC